MHTKYSKVKGVQSNYTIYDWSEWKWKLNKPKWQGKNSESEKKNMKAC